MKGIKIILLRESVLQSWLKDGLSFGVMFGLFYLNHEFTGGSGMIDFIIGVFIFASLIGIKAREELTIDEAIKYLKELKEM